MIKNVGLFLWNMKPDIFHNGHKNISNKIMGWSSLPTVGAAEEFNYIFFEIWLFL
jgi:hypothetical protein